MNLPPAGSDPAAIATAVDSYVRECALNPRRQNWETEAERGNQLYLGDHFQSAGTGDIIRVVLNRVLNVIIAQYALKAGTPAKTVFKPRDSGEPPICYLNTLLPEGRELAEQIAQQAAAAGVPWDESMPLPDDDVEMIRQQIALEERQAQQRQALVQQLRAAGDAAGAEQVEAAAPPAAISKDVLIEVTDRTAADALQQVYDGMEEASDAQLAYAENVLLTGILGVQSTLYEFDDDAKAHLLTNVHQQHVFLDPLRTDLRRMQYAIYVEPISADEAVALYPDLEQAIRDHFSTGSIRWPGTRQYLTGGMFDQQFEREMGVITHAWFRNQRFPMTPEQAVAAGKLESRDVPTGETAPQAHPETGEPMADELGRPVMAPVTRPAWFHPDGSELTPTVAGEDGKPRAHPKWPTRPGLRQVRCIAGRCVDDRECEFADIPLPTNTNIPVPYSPYGMGEPHRLEGIQMALNYVLSAIVTHQRYNAFPPEVMPQSVIDRLDDSLRKMRSRPGQRIGVPNDLLVGIRSIKDIVATLDVPAVPADFWKLLQFLVEMIDREGNQSDVMSGSAAPGWSGDAIASLQTAATQVIKATSMHFEAYHVRQARLKVHSILTRMDEHDWRRYLGKLPVQAIRALKDRHKSLDVDISVQVASGTGAGQQSKTNNLIAARQNGIPISDPTLMERLDIDPDDEAVKQANFDRKRAANAPAPQAAPAPQPPAKASAANNGSGGAAPSVGGRA